MAGAIALLATAVPGLVATPAAADPTNITWSAKPAVLVFGQVSTLTATSTTGNVVYGSDSTVCTVVADADPATATLTVAATSPGNNDCTFWAAEVLADTSVGPHDTVTVAVTKTAQTITFDPVADQEITSASVAMTASASSSLPVTLATSSSACHVDGTTAIFDAVGNCEVTAAQAGDDTYEAATSVTHTFAITNPHPRTPTRVGVTWSGTTATVTWTAPINDSPAQITGYRATAMPGDHTCSTADAGATTCDISGLSYGTSYSFSVVATSAYADSAPSTPAGPAHGLAEGPDGAYGCAIGTDGHVVCWGDDSWLRVDVPAELGTAVQVATAYTNACAVLTDTTVACWGNAMSPAIPDGLSGVVQISAGIHGFCAVTTANDLVCWGYSDEPWLAPPADLGKVKSVSAGQSGACAVRMDNTFRCWGNLDFDADVVAALTSGSTPHVKEVSFRYDMVCAVLTNNDLRCWGSDRVFQVTRSQGHHNVAHISTGLRVNCGITLAGGSFCWGQSPSEWYPDQKLAHPVSNVVTADHRACFIFANGTMSCLPVDSGGTAIPADVAVGSIATPIAAPASPTNAAAVRADEAAVVSFEAAPSSAAAPVDFYRVTTRGGDQSCDVPADAATLSCTVTGLTNGKAYTFTVVAVNSAGISATADSLIVTEIAHSKEGGHICAVTTEHTLRCWDNNAGPDEDANAARQTAVAHVGMTQDATCVLHTNGRVNCWGGWGSTVPADLPPMKSLVGSYYTMCGITQSDTVRCWGYSGYGQLDVPAGLENVVTLNSGVHGFCAVTTSHLASCWGGDGAVPPADLGEVASISVSWASSCAVLLADGSLRCWGDDGSGLVSSTPTSGVYTKVAVGNGTACAINDSSRAVCWGGDAAGSRAVPADLGTITSILVTWNDSICAVQTAGTIRCWGNWYDSVSGPGSVVAVPGRAPSAPREVGAYNSGNRLVVQWADPADDGGYPVTGYRAFTVPASGECTTDGSQHSCSIGSGLVAGRQYEVRVVATNEIGNSDTNTPVAMPTMAVSQWWSSHACGIDADHMVVCTGNNFADRVTVPADLGPVKTVVTGYSYGCARLEADDTVRCWGEDYVRTPPADLGPVKGLFGGWIGVCAIKADDSLACWGTAPATPADLGAVIDVWVGSGTTCAVTASHTVRCWAQWNDNAIAGQPADLVDVDKVITNDHFSCALLHNGHTRCWGAYAPTVTMTDGVSIVGADLGVCVLGSSGRVECRGETWDGRFDFHGHDFGVVAVHISGNVTCLDYAAAPYRSCFGAQWSIGELGATMLHGSIVTRAIAPAPPADALAVAGRRTLHVTLTASPSDGGSAIHHYRVTARGTGSSCEIPSDAATLECDLTGLANGRTYHVDAVAVNLMGVSRSARELKAKSVHSGADDGVCAITVDDHAVCWGYTGDPSWEVPSDLGTVLDVSTTVYGACAVLTAGTVRCWGGNPGESALNPPADLSDVVQISASGYHFCTRDSSGHIVCWGPNWSDVPVDLPPAVHVDSLSNGACILDAAGAVHCWGGYTDLPADMPVLASMSATEQNLCGIDMAAVVHCWGPDNGQVVSQVPVVDLAAVQISLGYQNACARYTDDSVRCWGTNGNGRANLGPDDGAFSFVKTSWGFYTCGVHTDHTIQCVGDGDLRTQPQPDLAGTPGAAPNPPSNLQVHNTPSGPSVSWDAPRLTGGFPITEYLVTAQPGGATCHVDEVADPGLHSCVVVGLTAGETYTFSAVAINAIGTSRTATTSLTPIQISIGGDTPNMASPACAVMSDNSVECWGTDNFGETDVPDNLPPVAKVATGGYFSCALLIAGGVRCWGGGTDSSHVNPPLDLGTIVDLQASFSDMCALTDEGRVRCWGYNDENITNGSLALSKPVARMSISPRSACAVYTDSTYTCWGYHYALPSGISEVKAASSSPWNTCVITMDDQVACLGDGSWGGFPSDLGSVKAIDVGLASVCVIKSDNTPVCWGWLFNYDMSAAPHVVSDETVQSVDAGWTSGCALTVTSHITCFGTHHPGELSTTLPPELAGPVSIVVAAAPGGAAISDVQRDLNGATLTWSPPADTGNSPILSSNAIATPGGATCEGELVDGHYSCRIDWLDPETDYEFDAVATNDMGASSYIVFPRIFDSTGPTGLVPVSARASDGRRVTLSVATPAVCGIGAHPGTVEKFAVGDCTVTASAVGLQPESRTFIIDPAHKAPSGLRMRIFNNLFHDNEGDLNDSDVSPCYDGAVDTIDLNNYDAHALFDPSCGTYNYAVHFTGNLIWPGTYDGTTTSAVRFRAWTDDGSKLSIDGHPIFYDWGYHGNSGPDTDPIAFLAGSVHRIDFWQFQGNGGSSAHLYWDAGTDTDPWDTIPAASWVPGNMDLPKAVNRLSWTPTTNLRHTAVNGEYLGIRALATGGTRVTYSVADGSDCVLGEDGRTIQITGSSYPCTFTAHSAGDTYALAATDITRTWITTDGDGKVTPVVTWPTAAGITQGQALSAATLTGGSANVAGTFAFTNASSIPPAGTANYQVTFTPENTATYATTRADVSVVVTAQVPHIATVPTAATIHFGQTLASATLSGGSATVSAESSTAVPGSFAFAAPATQPAVGAVTYLVVFTPTDNATWSTVTVPVMVTVQKADTSVTTAPAASSVVWGQSLADSSLTGGSAAVVGGGSLGGTFSFTSPGTSLVMGDNTVSVTFTPTASGNYNSSTTTVVVTMGKATPTVSTAPTASAIHFGQYPADSTLSGGVSSVAGAYAFVSPRAALGVGANSVSVRFTPTDATHFTTVTFLVTLTVGKATPVVSRWPNAAPLAFGQHLSDSALTYGEANVPGSFAWTNPETAVHGGTSTQSVAFIPTDLTTYNIVNGTTTVTTSRVNPVIDTVPTASEIGYGQPVSASTLTGGHANAAGTFSFVPGQTLALGENSVRVTFTPIDTVDYNTVTVSVVVVVHRGEPAIRTQPVASALKHGQRLQLSSLTHGAAQTAGSFTWVDPEVVPADGVTFQEVSFAPNDADHFVPVTFTVPVLVMTESAVKSLPKKEFTINGQLVPGSTVTVSGSGFHSGDYVLLVVASDPKVLAQTRANSNGVATATVTLPARLAIGKHTLTLYSQSSGQGFSMPVKLHAFTVASGSGASSSAPESASPSPSASQSPTPQPTESSAPSRSGGSTGAVKLLVLVLVAGLVIAAVRRKPRR